MSVSPVPDPSMLPETTPHEMSADLTPADPVSASLAAENPASESLGTEDLGTENLASNDRIPTEVLPSDAGSESSDTSTEETPIASETESSLPNPVSAQEDSLSEVDTRDTLLTLNAQILTLTQQKEALQKDVTTLKEQRSHLTQEIDQLQGQLGTLVESALEQLQQRKHDLNQAIEKLEQRHAKIQAEMRQNFAGVSQELAIRVQSFKDYLVGSLQDLVVAAEELNLVPPPAPAPPPVETSESSKKSSSAGFGDDGFKAQSREIRRLLDQYRTNPDYYGPAWQLRRTFEPIHAERVSNWFFEQGGRGAIRGLGTRSQNVLVASAIISVLNEFYGEQLVTLVLANTPESLGEWRRGLQDCLGISRADFGPNQGIALYEDPAPLVQKADRLVQNRDFPLVIIDEAEALIDLSLLQFPLWLAFVSDPRRQSQWS